MIRGSLAVVWCLMGWWCCDVGVLGGRRVLGNECDGNVVFDGAKLLRCGVSSVPWVIGAMRV